MHKVKPYKACLACFQLFRKRKVQSQASFDRQVYCHDCAKDHLIIQPKESTFFVKKKLDLITAKVERTVEKPQRKEPEPMPPQRRARNEYVYAKMNSLEKACAIYAERNSLPIEWARALWGLKSTD